MINKYATKIIIALLFLGVGYYIGSGNKEIIETKAETEIVEKIVERIVTVTVKPDGTKITETKDKVQNKNERATIQHKEQKQYIPQYGISLKSSVFNKSSYYTIEADRRIFANISAGVYVRSDLSSSPEFGASLRFEF